MMTVTENCPHCGQGHMIVVPDDAAPEVIREAAVKACDCEEAEREKELASARKRIEALFGEESKKLFDTAFDIGVRERLELMAIDVYDELYDKAVLYIGDDKVSIWMSGGHLKLMRDQKVKLVK